MKTAHPRFISFDEHFLWFLLTIILVGFILKQGLFQLQNCTEQWFTYTFLQEIHEVYQCTLSISQGRFSYHSLMSLHVLRKIKAFCFSVAKCLKCLFQDSWAKLEHLSLCLQLKRLYVQVDNAQIDTRNKTQSFQFDIWIPCSCKDDLCMGFQVLKISTWLVILLDHLLKANWEFKTKNWHYLLWFHANFWSESTYFSWLLRKSENLMEFT